MFEKDVKQDFNIDLTEAQVKKFQSYFSFLIEYNEITNLTRITEEKDVYYKHFYDSLSLCKTLDMRQISTMCDMGAGAGFPSIPLKILFPNLKITIIDSLGKRITFLKKLIEILNLDHVNLVYDRIENYALKNREQYDLVTARALGKLPIILELGMPMVKRYGLFIAYKSSHYEDELESAKDAIKILGGKLNRVNEIELPYDYGNRSHIVIEKVFESPNIYPRAFAAIKKKNL